MGKGVASPSGVGVGVKAAAVAVAAVAASAVAVAWGSVTAPWTWATSSRRASSTSSSVTLMPISRALIWMTFSSIIWSNTWVPRVKGLERVERIWLTWVAKRSGCPSCWPKSSYWRSWFSRLLFSRRARFQNSRVTMVSS